MSAPDVINFNHRRAAPTPLKSLYEADYSSDDEEQHEADQILKKSLLKKALAEEYRSAVKKKSVDTLLQGQELFSVLKVPFPATLPTGEVLVCASNRYLPHNPLSSKVENKFFEQEVCKVAIYADVTQFRKLVEKACERPEELYRELVKIDKRIVVQMYSRN